MLYFNYQLSMQHIIIKVLWNMFFVLCVTTPWILYPTSLTLISEVKIMEFSLNDVAAQHVLVISSHRRVWKYTMTQHTTVHQTSIHISQVSDTHSHAHVLDWDIKKKKKSTAVLHLIKQILTSVLTLHHKCRPFICFFY